MICNADNNQILPTTNHLKRDLSIVPITNPPSTITNEFKQHPPTSTTLIISTLQQTENEESDEILSSISSNSESDERINQTVNLRNRNEILSSTIQYETSSEGEEGEEDIGPDNGGNAPMLRGQTSLHFIIVGGVAVVITMFMFVLCFRWHNSSIFEMDEIKMSLNSNTVKVNMNNQQKKEYETEANKSETETKRN